MMLDGSGRLAVPFAIRRKLDPKADGTSFYVLPGEYAGTLALYPERYFEQRRPQRPEETLSRATYEWHLFEFSQCVLLDPDKQGRILIPDYLLQRVGIGKEVVLSGAQDHLLLWDRRRFEAFEQEYWSQFPGRREQALQELRAAAAARPLADSRA